MILQNFSASDIQRCVQREQHELASIQRDFYWHQVTKEKTDYLHLARISAGFVRSHTLICVPGKRAEYYVELDGSLAYFPHLFDRYCERVSGMYASQRGGELKWPVCIEQRAARYIFDTQHLQYQFIGVTNEYHERTGSYNRGIALLGDNLLMLKMDAPCGIPIVETFLDPERISKYPDQQDTVRIAQLGDMPSALDAYNRYVAKKQAFLSHQTTE